MTKKVFVTGARGLIGKETLLPLLNKGYEVYALTTGGTAQDEKINWVRGNLFDYAAMKELIADIKPTHLLHLAWQTTGMFNDNMNFDFLCHPLIPPASKIPDTPLDVPLHRRQYPHR